MKVCECVFATMRARAALSPDRATAILNVGQKAAALSSSRFLAQG